MKPILLAPVFAVILILVLTSVSMTVHAQSDTNAAPAAASTKVKFSNATVRSINSAEHVIVVEAYGVNDSGHTLTLHLDDKTVITKSGQPAKLTDFYSGNACSGLYIKDASGTMTLIKLNLIEYNN